MLNNERIAKRIIGLEKPGPDLSVQKVRQILADVRGRVLEIGPGAGNLLPYFDSSIDYIGLEPNTFLHPALRVAIDKRAFASSEIIAGSAEQIPFADSSFDAVVSVRTLCSMHDLPRTLSEIKRVLKPGGIFVFAEHVAAQRGSWRWFLQQLTRPLWAYRTGCSPAVEIGPAIEQAGFSKVNIESFQVGGRKNIVVRLRIFGTAVK